MAGFVPEDGILGRNRLYLMKGIIILPTSLAYLKVDLPSWDLFMVGGGQGEGEVSELPYWTVKGGDNGSSPSTGRFHSLL